MTPGPWLVDPKHYVETGLVREDDETGGGYHIIEAGEACSRRTGFHIAACITKADARLIAAAPDLLGALESLLDDDTCECWNSGDGCRHDGARAAIQKARGK